MINPKLNVANEQFNALLEEAFTRRQSIEDATNRVEVSRQRTKGVLDYASSIVSTTNGSNRHSDRGGDCSSKE